jgi:very-short-patch-repair endonuclease
VLRVVGSAETPHQRAMAAVLDASDAAVALASALALWGVPGWRLEPVHVLTGRRPHRGSPHLGIVHSSTRLDPTHLTVVDGIPVTTPARTLLDLSLRLSTGKLEDLCDDLLRRRTMALSSFHELAAELPEAGGPAGWAVLRRLAAARPEGYVPTGSRLERRFEEILEEAGERPFSRQVDVGDADGWIGRVDFADRRLKVIVEVQGGAFHSTISDRRRDAERIARLRAAGWIVVEVHEREIWSNPAAVVAKVRAARARAERLAA